MSENPVTWWEIQVPDLEQAKAFYGGVFGWTFKAWMDGYEGIHLNDTMIGGLTRMAGDVAGRGVHVCFTVDRGEDTLEGILARIERHGGRIAKGRTEIGGDMGWYATAADPSGVLFDLWSGRPA
jgi:uncharacterized protein